MFRTESLYRELSSYLYKVVTTFYIFWYIPLFKWETILWKPDKIIPQG